MKSITFKKWLVTSLSSLVLVGTIACGNSGGGGGSSTPNYTMNNGQCYNSAGQITSYSYCGVTAGSVGYSLVNGQCVYTATNQVVAPQNCTLGTQSSAIFNYPTGVYPGYQSPGVIAGICSGVYYYAIYGYFQPVWCDAPFINNCEGYTLINGYGQFEYCL